MAQRPGSAMWHVLYLMLFIATGIFATVLVFIIIAMSNNQRVGALLVPTGCLFKNPVQSTHDEFTFDLLLTAVWIYDDNVFLAEIPYRQATTDSSYPETEPCWINYCSPLFTEYYNITIVEDCPTEQYIIDGKKMVYLTDDPFGYKFSLVLCVALGFIASVALIVTMKHFITSLISYCNEEIIIEVKQPKKSSFTANGRTYTFLPA